MNSQIKYRALIVVSLVILSFSSCMKKMDAILISDKELFFDKTFNINNRTDKENGAIKAFGLVHGDNMAFIENAISELKKLELNDKFVSKVKKHVGLPIWGESIVIKGGDSASVLITPIYDTSTNKVTGAIFSIKEPDGDFNFRILPRKMVKKGSDTSTTLKHVSKNALNAIFSKLDESKSVLKGHEVFSSTIGGEVIHDNIVHIVYEICWQTVVYSPAYPSAGVYSTTHCTSHVFWGTYSEWDYYYGLGYAFVEPGYYESYDENEIAKARENNWERDRVDTTGLNDCLKALIGRLMSNNSNDMGKIMRRFMYEPLGYDLIQLDELNLAFKVKPVLNAAAETVTINPYNQRIDVNAQVFGKCSDLYAIQTIMHESIHALMNTLIQRAIASSNNAGFWIDVPLKPYPEVFDRYIDYLYIGINIDSLQRAGEYQHDFMANHLVSLMSDALAEFDNFQQEDEYYWNLCWGGLYKTDSWKRFDASPALDDNDKRGFKYALTRERMDRIKQIDFNEQDDNVNAKGRKHNTNNCY